VLGPFGIVSGMVGTFGTLRAEAGLIRGRGKHAFQCTTAKAERNHRSSDEKVRSEHRQ
jgi:hypothetical protein